MSDEKDADDETSGDEGFEVEDMSYSYS